MFALFVVMAVIHAWVGAYMIEKRWGLRWALAFLVIFGAIVGGICAG
jgi:hypothetical protein